MPVLGLDPDAGGLEAGGEFFRDDDGTMASATAHDVDVDAEAAAGHGQEGQSASQAALDDRLEPGVVRT